MKVNVTKAGHYAKVKGVLTELELGEQDIETKVAESMIANGYAEEVKQAAKPKSKQAE